MNPSRDRMVPNFSYDGPVTRQPSGEEAKNEDSVRRRFSPIVTDMDASKRLYIDGLNLPLEGDYPMTEKIEGVKHFGLWSLRDAARSCFGTDEWPDHIPAPQATVEFEVADVESAAKELEANGYGLLHPARANHGSRRSLVLSVPKGLSLAFATRPGSMKPPSSGTSLQQKRRSGAV